MKYTGIVSLLILLTLTPNVLNGQTGLVEALDTLTLREQVEEVQKRTRIYENYRAIREDIFQKMKSNSIDSLLAAKKEISELRGTLQEKESEISSLKNSLEKTGDQLDEAVKNRDALTFLGIQMDKKFYNTIMWFLVGGLALAAVILFLIFRRNRVVTLEYRKELSETKDQFDTYKKEARERYEKLVVDHHNEIMKLKGKQL
ncbi:MAG: hypothetical protein JXR52_10370 [Bacteroidales bacterium]|nr:hypothetical protein [Bacteroidales bacterium]MBN2699218.1 hypothetical protein [Bacteroidales bacterium]